MVFQSPAGRIRIKISDGYVNEVIFINGDHTTISSTDMSTEDKKTLEQCMVQLDEYFSGKRKKFNLPLKQIGTPFQEKVWNELMHIPFGKTISYVKFAQRLGDVKAIRAAASANGKNHISIIVPCHRVIGSDGSLTGYGGGISRKKWLLDHENKYANGVVSLF